MEPIYLDHAATTPVRPAVTAAMAPYLSGLVGNPSSVHRWGREARRTVEDARARSASVLGTAPGEVFFVRGGTESVNLAIRGIAADLRDSGSAGSVFLRSPFEHSAVRESMDALPEEDVEVRELHWDGAAGLEVPRAETLSRAGVGLVSCQWVNHETGMVLPVAELASECDRAGVPLHVDAIQAAGHVNVRCDRDRIPLLSLSGHKLGGPAGTGILVVREGTRVAPTQYGGNQEGGLRPGTEDVAGAVGIARALELCVETLPAEAERLGRLRDRLETKLVAAVPELVVLGGGFPRAPHISGLGVPGLPVDLLPGGLDLEGVGASAGSACKSGSTVPSPTVRVLSGQDQGPALLRLSLGWSTTSAEVEMAIEIVASVVRRALEARTVGAS